MNKVLSLLIQFDIWCMVTFLGGKQGETISAAAYNSEVTGKIGGRIGRPIIDLLFYPFQKQHCYNAWLWQRSLYD